MNEEIQIILETTEKVLQKNINHQLRQNIDQKNNDLINLWNEVEEIGLPKIVVKEKFDGFNLEFASVLPIIQLANSLGAPIPLSETILCNYILSECDINPLEGMITFANATKNIKILGNELSGELISVPFLNLTDKIMFITKIDGVEKVVFLQNSHLDIEQKKNFLAEPRFNVNLKNNNIIEIKTLNPKINFNYLGAILRSAQMIGSMEKILNLSIDYCSQRKQFGRPLSKFQAIQHQISEMAVELSASSAALSTIASSEDLSKNIYDIAILKIRTGIAAGKIIAISHQVHGAIGFTKEYELAYFTKNLNSWRNDFGNESYWEEFLGKDFLENSNKNLWEYLTY